MSGPHWRHSETALRRLATSNRNRPAPLRRLTTKRAPVERMTGNGSRNGKETPHSIVSTLTDSLLRSKNTILLAFRIPRNRLDNTYRWYLRQWPVWTSASDRTKSAVSKSSKVLYRDAAGMGAWLDLREEQIAARIKLGTIGIGLLLAGSGWVWLIIAAPSSGATFAAVTVGLFLVNALLVAPAAAHTANPWRRLGQLAVGWAAISVGLLASAGWPPLTAWFQQPPHALQILAFATGSIALFSLLGALLARIAFFVVDLTIVRRRVRQFPQITALLRTVELIDWIRTDDNIGEAWRRRWAIRKLELVSQCVEKGIPGLLAMPAHKAGDAARHRFHQAATTIVATRRGSLFPSRKPRLNYAAASPSWP